MWKTCYYHAANDCLITVENCILKLLCPFSRCFINVFPIGQISLQSKITAEDNITAVGSSRHRRIAFARGKNIVSSLLQCVPCFVPRNDIVRFA